MKKTGEAPPRRRILQRAGEILLILSLLLLSWLPGGLTAYGWILHADHYGAEFAAFGRWMFVLYGLMTLAVLLYFFRRDIAAAALGVGSYVTVLCIVSRAVSIAEQYSWAGQTEQSMTRSAASVWRECHWHAVTLLLLLVLAAARYFSYDAMTARKQKREAEENAPAPSILGGNDSEAKEQEKG